MNLILYELIKKTKYIYHIKATSSENWYFFGIEQKIETLLNSIFKILRQ